MILYLCARLATWLFGYSWPLNDSPLRSALVIFSSISATLEVLWIIKTVSDSIGGKRK